MIHLLIPVLFASWPMANMDASRTGWNPSETVLTPASVSGSQFGNIGNYTVDGALYAQPLVVPVSGRNVLITCTMNNSCYGFDADSIGTQIWKTPLGATPRSCGASLCGQFYSSLVGCVATPAIDMLNSWIFALCTNSTPTWVLYKLSLLTGSVISSVTVTGTANGNTFNPGQETGRTALTVANGNVYLMFSSYNDQTPWNGWAFAYSEAILSQMGVFCTTSSSGNGGGLWQAGGGPVVDSGNLYVSSGNGTYDGVSNFGDSLLKLSPSLNLLDWFTVSNYATLNTNDADPSSNRTLLIPGTSTLIHSGKAFQAILVSTANMGHLQGGGGQAPIQTWTMSGTMGPESGAYGSVWMNNTWYLPNTQGLVSAFSFNGSTFNTVPSASTSLGAGFPGASAMSGSSNGSSSGILWVVTSNTTADSEYNPQQGVLHALSASTLVEIWKSGSIGVMSKFSPPAVVNGKVYVATQSSIQVFGISSPPAPAHGGHAIHSDARATQGPF